MARTKITLGDPNFNQYVKVENEGTRLFLGIAGYLTRKKNEMELEVTIDEATKIREALDKHIKKVSPGND